MLSTNMPVHHPAAAPAQHGGPRPAARPTPLLRVDGLGKQFPARDGRAGAAWVIRDLSFTVNEGEFVTLVGPSGSGKTTLLNILAQIDPASAGDVYLNGEKVSPNDPRQLQPGFGGRIGYITQDHNLLPWRTTIDNVLFPLEAQGRLTQADRDRVDALFEAVGLSEFKNHYPHELSGGMKKRAAVIRTLAYDPPIILMDEPFGALDAETRAHLQADLLKLWAVGRKTIVFVTHDIAEAIALGDRTLVLTRAPATIAGEHAIHLPRPRNIRDIYGMPGFAELYQAIRSQVL